MKYILSLILLSGACLLLPAQNSARQLQLQLQLAPGQALSDASHLFLIHSDPQETGIYLRFQLRPESGRLLVFQSPVFILKPGNHSYSLPELFPAIRQQTSAQSGKGEICVQAYSTEQVLLAQICQPFQNIPAIPPHLVYPFDGEKLSVPLPVFSWTPPMPVLAYNQLRYEMTIVELTDFHPPAAAIRALPPFYQQTDLQQNLHPYDPAAPGFETGRQYAWQVRAYNGSQFVGQTEVWTFSPAVDEEEKDGLPFVELRKRYDSGIYQALGKVKFRFDEYYGEKLPEIHVLDAGGREIKIAGHKLSAKAQNLFVLDLPPGSGLQEGAFYELIVKNYKGEAQKLRFKYFYP